MSSLNYESIDGKIDFIINELADLKNGNVDVPRLKELNNTLKTKIFLHTKVLSYCQLNKKGTVLPFFENKN